MGKRKPNVVKCDAIETGRFELVDKDGTARAELIMCSSGPLFRMFTEDGHERLRLEVRDSYPVVQLRSATSVRARLALKQWEEDDNGAIVFDLFGEGDGSTPEPALWAHVNADGSSGFVVDYAGLSERGGDRRFSGTSPRTYAPNRADGSIDWPTGGAPRRKDWRGLWSLLLD